MCVLEIFDVCPGEFLCVCLRFFMCFPEIFDWIPRDFVWVSCRYLMGVLEIFKLRLLDIWRVFLEIFYGFP